MLEIDKRAGQNKGGIVDKLNDAIHALVQIANITDPDADLRAIARKALEEMGAGNLVNPTKIKEGS